MPLLESIELTDWRNFSARRFVFESSRIVLLGRNGIGKTNLLESIAYLSLLRSFKTTSSHELVRLKRPFFQLKGRVRNGAFPVDLKLFQEVSGKRHTWINDTPVSRSSDFIREFRTVAFIPEDRNIPGGSALYRRRYFDTFLSLIDEDYMKQLLAYARALSQRNAALKSGRTELIRAFEPELAEQAPKIAGRRLAAAREIAAKVNFLAGSDAPPFEITYAPVYPCCATDYLKHLEKERPNELRHGCTLFGPHLDDFAFFFDGKPVRSYASTGQIRLLGLLLKMAEFALFKEQSPLKTAVLVDDVTGELDDANKERFLAAIASADQQFFTFTNVPGFIRQPEIVRL